MNIILFLILLCTSLTPFPIFADHSSQIQQREEELRRKHAELEGLQTQNQSLEREAEEAKFVLEFFGPYIDAAIRTKKLLDEDISDIQLSLSQFSNVPEISKMREIPVEQMHNFYFTVTSKLNDLSLTCEKLQQKVAYALPRVLRLLDINQQYETEQALIDRYMPQVRGHMGNLVSYANSRKKFLVGQINQCGDLKRKIRENEDQMSLYWTRTITRGNAEAIMDFERMMKTNEILRTIEGVYRKYFYEVFDLIRRMNFYKAVKELRQSLRLRDLVQMMVRPYILSDEAIETMNGIDQYFQSRFEEQREKIRSVPRNEWLSKRFAHVEREYGYVLKKYGATDPRVKRMKRFIDTAKAGQLSYMKEAHIYSLLEYAENEYVALYK